METTALRLHRAWMEPLTSMLWGIGWWRRQSRLKEEGGGTGLACMTQLPQPEGVTGSSLEPAWLGTAWLLHGEPSSDLAAPSGERCALQIQADGTLFARRRLSAWTPLLNSAVETSADAPFGHHFGASRLDIGLSMPDLELRGPKSGRKARP